MATIEDVAQWLLDEICDHEVLFQKDAITEIARQYGEEFLYLNKNGNISISRAVLAEFRKIRSPDIEWNDGERSWHVNEMPFALRQPEANQSLDSTGVD